MQTPTLITLTLSLLALSVSATPPACLLAAVNEQATPSDLKALCGTLENAVVGNITEKCAKDTYEEAVSSYKSTCLGGAGVTITITSSSSSASATATGTSTASGSATATASGTGARITGSGSATGTSGSTASATGSSAAATVTAAGNGAGALVVPGFLGAVGLVGAFLF